jgi:hypothetical protein
MVFGKNVGLCALAVFIGAALAPFSILLSLELLPVLSSAVLYGILAFGFGFLSPRRSWRWGLWVTLGIPMAMFVVPLADLVGLALGVPTGTPFSFGFLWVTLILGYLPGVAGGSAGGYLGAAAANLRHPQEVAEGSDAGGSEGP